MHMTGLIEHMSQKSRHGGTAIRSPRYGFDLYLQHPIYCVPNNSIITFAIDIGDICANYILVDIGKQDAPTRVRQSQTNFSLIPCVSYVTPSASPAFPETMTRSFAYMA